MQTKKHFFFIRRFFHRVFKNGGGFGDELISHYFSYCKRIVSKKFKVHPKWLALHPQLPLNRLFLFHIVVAHIPNNQPFPVAFFPDRNILSCVKMVVLLMSKMFDSRK